MIRGNDLAKNYGDRFGILLKFSGQSFMFSFMKSIRKQGNFWLGVVNLVYVKTPHIYLY